MWFDVADKFIISAHNNTYPVVLLNDEITVDQDIEEHLYSDEPEETETEYKYADSTDKKINQTNLRVDKQGQKIEGLITQIGDRSEKTTSITADIEGLQSKVSNIQDLTQTTSGNKTITLANCAEGNLLSLRIKGNNTVFKYLYPEDDLYPADDLYPMGDSRILVNDSLYELGITEVLRKNEDVYDEFILENGQAKVIRRINKDGSIKEEEIVEDLGELSIPLNEGENTIQIKNYYAEIEARYAVKNDYTEVFATKVEMHTSIAQTAEDINTEVSKKVDETELGTKITQNYESVQIAWNSISEFIQFLNAMLQILGENKKLLMSLDKTGMHFYNSSGQEIGNIGIYNSEVSFYINGDVSGSSMSWGINKTINGEKKYFPVFLYEGYNSESGTEFGGKFLLEAPLIMQENTLYLGQDMDSSYIQGQETDNRKSTTIGNTDDFYIYNSSGNLIFVINSSYLKFYDYLEMGLNSVGNYSFDFKDNYITNVGNMATSDDVNWFSAGNNYLYVGKRDGSGFSLYTSSSDKKLKKNIKNADGNALDIIKKIKHKQFDWKTTDEHQDIGYIAQEMEKINKNFVHHHTIKDKDGNKTEDWQINILTVLATATKAIQELQEQIENLKAEIKELKEENNGKN